MTLCASRALHFLGSWLPFPPATDSSGCAAWPLHYTHVSSTGMKANVYSSKRLSSSVSEANQSVAIWINISQKWAHWWEASLIHAYLMKGGWGWRYAKTASLMSIWPWICNHTSDFSLEPYLDHWEHGWAIIQFKNHTIIRGKARQPFEKEEQGRKVLVLVLSSIIRI